MTPPRGGEGLPAWLLRALAGAGGSLLVVSALAFALVSQMPSDPVTIAIRAWNLPATPETVARLRAEWGLDGPAPGRYALWLSGLVAGDWGRSFRTGEPVAAEILARLPLSLGLGAAGLALAALLAVPLGFLGARRPRGAWDLAGRALAVLTQALPAVWVGLILLWVLGVQLRLIRPFALDWTAYALAIGLVALGSLGELARVFRRDLLDSARQPWFVTALAKGRGRTGALWHHGGRAAAFALVAATRAQAGWALGGTAAIEVLLGLPGLGQFLVASVQARDHQVLLAYVMAVAAWMILVNLAATFALRRLDPRS